MKKILTFLMPAVISFSSAPALANVMTANNSVKSEQAILELNFSEQKSFKPSLDIISGKVKGDILSFSLNSIGKNWNEIVAKYPHYTFKNTSVQVGPDLQPRIDNFDREFLTKDLIKGPIISDMLVHQTFFLYSLVFMAYVDTAKNDIQFLGTYSIKNSLGVNPDPFYDVNFGQIVFF